MLDRDLALAQIKWQVELALSGYESLTPQAAASGARDALECVMRILDEAEVEIFSEAERDASARALRSTFKAVT